MAQFDDGKDQGALRTIGEVADALGIRQHVLRYWEQQFPALQPLKRSGGRRYYRTQDVALLETIDRLVNREGYTLKGAIKLLGQTGPRTGLRTGADTSMMNHDQDVDPPAPEQPSLGLLTGAAELPHDGGLDAFFGRGSDSAAGASRTAQADGGTPVPASLAAQLQAIRDRLAQALAA